MDSLQNIVRNCSKFNRGLDEIEPLVFSLTRRSPTVTEEIQELLRQERDPENTYPSNWYTNMALSRAIAHTLTRKEQIQKIFRKHRNELPDEANDVLKHLLKQPVRWAAFTVNGRLDKNLFSITDVFAPDTQLPPLYSKGVSDLLRSSVHQNMLFVTLLLDNGNSLQTYGIIHQYLSVIKGDLDFFCTVVDEDVYTAQGISGFINRHFNTFFILDTISQIPPIGFRGSPARIIWWELHLEGIYKTVLPGEWGIEESDKGVRKYAFLGPDEELEALKPMVGQDPEHIWELSGLFTSYLYIYSAEETVCIYASSIHDYVMLYQVLSCRFDLDKESPNRPAFHITPSVWTEVSSLPGIDLPWAWYEKQFENEDLDNEREESESDEDAVTRTSLNTLVDEVINARNAGTEVDIQKRCRELDVDPALAESVLARMDEMTKKMMPELELTEEDRTFEISGLTKPSPALRRMFSTPLYRSDLFSVTDTLGSYELFLSHAGDGYASRTIPGELADYITSLFEQAFGRFGSTIMNCFFYMLMQQEKRWTPVRSYGIEVLKLFHRILLPELGVTKDAFLLRFSRFVLTSLCPNGLLELSERPRGEARTRGTYPVRSSMFFQNFIVFNPEQTPQR